MTFEVEGVAPGGQVGKDGFENSIFKAKPGGLRGQDQGQ